MAAEATLEIGRFMWYPAAALLFVLMQTPDYSAEGLKALDGANYAVALEQFSKV